MAQKIINTKIQEAYDTEANWIKYNPVLLAGQLAFSKDKYGKYKIGDGIAKWSQLQYMTLGWNDITGKPSSFTPSSHTHDDRYFTETEATNKFSPKEGSASLSKLASTITLGAGDAATILQNGSTYQQKIEIIDNSTSGDAVFGFYQSGDSGKNFNKLMTINDDGNVVANKFTGALAGNASSASSVPWSGVSGKPSTFPPSTHKHPASQITGLPTKLPNPYALTVKGNGALINTYDGSGAKEINITPAVIGAATSGHTHSQYAPTSHNHSASQVTSGVLPISRGGTGGADRKSAMSGLAYLGGNVTGGKANDTRAFWEGKGTGYAWFSSGNQINSQPSTYGYLITICSGSEIHQEWWTQSTGTHYYRGVNSSATAMPAWTRIYDANSIIPVTNGGTGANTYSAALKNLVVNGAVSGSAVPTDTNWYLCSDTADSSGTPVRRPMSSLWSYIKGKTDPLYQSKGSYAAASHTHNYAGSSSAGGAANSAIKLATARTINGISFDGTKNIEIPNNYSKQLTSEDLNTLLTPGNYFAAGGNTVKNKPSSVENFGLVMYKTAAGHIAQKLHGSNNIIYYRRHDGTSFNSWSEIYSSVNKPTPSEIGAAASSHSHSNYATTTNLSLANQRIDAHEKELGVHKTLIDGKAPSNHSHNTIRDFKDGEDISISTSILVTPNMGSIFDFIISGTQYGANQLVTMSSNQLGRCHAHTISQITDFPNIKAITNSQIDSLASL